MIRQDSPPTFRQRLVANETMIGTFVKSVDPHSIEILGIAGFDFVVIDAEHAPFDRRALDTAILACRAAGVHGVVRVRNASAAEILNALDIGAEGVLVPHVSSVAQATDVVRMSKHRGARGYSNSPRAGRFGARGMWEHVDRADEDTAIITMIEDESAVRAVADIMDVPGVDAVFVGRGDLAVAMNDRTSDAVSVAGATDDVLAAGRGAGTPVLLFVADATEAKHFRERGVQIAVIGSDDGFLRKAASAVVVEMARAAEL